MKTLLKTVRITLRVTDFVDVIKDNTGPCHRSTKARIFGPRKNSRVKVKTVHGRQEIFVESKGAALRLEFTVNSAIPGQQFYPRGIAFVNTGYTPDTDYKKSRIARPGDFPFDELCFSNGGRTLTIPDAFKDPGKNDRYEFSLLIQSNDGSIGIIDPPITHNN